jgi:hypothetical protein
MIHVKKSEPFKEDAIYLAYTNDTGYGRLIRIIIFSPILDTTLTTNIMWDYLNIKHFYTRSMYSNPICGDGANTILFHVRQQEIWRLTDDEVLVMLSEVV